MKEEIRHDTGEGNRERGYGMVDTKENERGGMSTSFVESG